MIFMMILMIEKGIRGWICHAIHRYAKSNDKYMKNYNKCVDLYSISNQYFLCIQMQIICMDGECFKKYQ